MEHPMPWNDENSEQYTQEPFPNGEWSNIKTKVLAIGDKDNLPSADDSHSKPDSDVTSNFIFQTNDIRNLVF